MKLGIILGIVGVLFLSAFAATQMAQPTAAINFNQEEGQFADIAKAPKPPCYQFEDVTTKDCDDSGDLGTRECSDFNGDACSAVCISNADGTGVEWLVSKCASGSCDPGGQKCKPQRSQIADIMEELGDNGPHRGP